MARLKVTKSEKGPGGSIIGLFGPTFGYRMLSDIVADIEVGEHTYCVREASYESVVRVIHDGEDELHIRSTWDVLSRNNLSNLPDY